MGEPVVVFSVPAMASKHAQTSRRPAVNRRLKASLGLPSALLIAAMSAQLLSVPRAQAYVALMAGQRARPLNGQFNRVPVLHSNQPEEVEGPGILINTAPGVTYSPESGQTLRNAEYTFNGDFGVHLHHKYFPPYRRNIDPSSRRSELTVGLILINPGYRPVRIQFSSGAVRNSFEAPYLANSHVGVRPLGPRPWNTGPGDATAVQMLRERLDPKLADDITIPPRSRIVLFQTDIPALGIANALLRGRSDGPFQMAVVAARQPQSDFDLINILDQGQLAPGRVYLNRIAEINNRSIFSRVGGVALGDTYTAQVNHDLEQQGPLHVPLTSTNRHNFGTKEIQVNPLASRMLDSSLDNVGTYGVRYVVDLNLRGSGQHDLVLSHPIAYGGKSFIAFRGSLQVVTPEGPRDYHVVLRSGQSLAVTSLNLQPGADTPIRLSLVYPADATPGHLLSVVPNDQLARLQDQERMAEQARLAAERAARAAQANRRNKGKGKGKPATAKPAALAEPTAPPAVDEQDTMADVLMSPPPVPMTPAVTLPPAQFPAEVGPVVAPTPQLNQSLIDRYQQALEAQQSIMRGLMTR
ncbi:MAG: DUF3370 family protein [Cyanobacteriota bacterium]|nr:DUF3370 family protein [Cyanobacteriota bacterium]